MIDYRKVFRDKVDVVNNIISKYFHNNRFTGILYVPLPVETGNQYAAIYYDVSFPIKTVQVKDYVV